MRIEDFTYIYYMTPREYAVKNNCEVTVYSNGMVWADGEIKGLEVIQADMDNIFYPDGTSEWERMNYRAMRKK